jgi:hypothetical protein
LRRRLWYIEDDGQVQAWLAAARETASAELASDDKYFPSRRAAELCNNNKCTLRDYAMIYLSSHHCVLLLSSIANI